MTPISPAAAGSETMRAFVLQGLGGALENIRLHNIPKPVPAKGEILIRVAAVDVNPGERKIRTGAIPNWAVKATGMVEVWPPKPGPHRPFIMGVSASGIVEEAPEGSRFKKGARVVVRKEDLTPGTLCEFTAAKESDSALLPDNVSMVDAVALATVGIAATQVFTYINGSAETPGATMLVNGGAGGVGSVVVQLAKNKGYSVTATARASNADRVKALGADTVIDYQKVFYEQYAVEKGGFDVIVDTVGDSQNAPATKAVKKGGVFIRLATAFIFWKPLIQLLIARLWHALFGGPRYQMHFSRANGAQLEELMVLAGQGKLKATVDKVFSFADAPKAHDYQEMGANGKVVVVVDPALK